MTHRRIKGNRPPRCLVDVCDKREVAIRKEEGPRDAEPALRPEVRVFEVKRDQVVVAEEG